MLKIALTLFAEKNTESLKSQMVKNTVMNCTMLTYKLMPRILMGSLLLVTTLYIYYNGA